MITRQYTLLLLCTDYSSLIVNNESKGMCTRVSCVVVVSWCAEKLALTTGCTFLTLPTSPAVSFDSLARVRASVRSFAKQAAVATDSRTAELRGCLVLVLTVTRSWQNGPRFSASHTLAPCAVFYQSCSRTSRNCDDAAPPIVLLSPEQANRDGTGHTITICQ